MDIMYPITKRLKIIFCGIHFKNLGNYYKEALNETADHI